VGRGPSYFFTGIQVLDPRLLERLPAGASDSVRDLYIPMIRAGEAVHGAAVSGAWYDLGRPWLYLGAQVEMLAAGASGASPRPSLIDPGARVASAARVSASVVGKGARIAAGAFVTRSLLLSGSRVGAGARVVDSVLGHDARVKDGESLCRVLVEGRVRSEMR
jgi:mannose-1-phosphate guanylyltransferase